VKLFYVPRQQREGAYTEYVSGPDGLFETQVKSLGVDVMAIRPHDHMLKMAQEVPGLITRAAWGFAQAERLIQMFATGFIGPRDIIYFEEDRQVGLQDVDFVKKEVGRDQTRFYYQDYGVVYGAQAFLKAAGFDGDFEPSAADDRHKKVLFWDDMQIGKGNGIGLLFFAALAESVMKERTDITFEVVRRVREPIPSSIITEIIDPMVGKFGSRFAVSICNLAEWADKLSTSSVLILTDRAKLKDLNNEQTYALCEAATMGCAPLCARAWADTLAGSEWNLFDWPDLFSAKLKLYALLNGTVRDYKWVSGVYERSVQRMLLDMGYQVDEVPTFEDELEMLAERRALENRK
jgi:hypothetical protein